MYGGKLVGERSRHPSVAYVSELQFADDLVAVATNCQSIEKASCSSVGRGF